MSEDPILMNLPGWNVYLLGMQGLGKPGVHQAQLLMTGCPEVEDADQGHHH